MLERAGYLEEYVKFWNERAEVDRIWVSVYTPQIGEHSAEMLTPGGRTQVASELPSLAKKYPKLLFHDGLAKAFLRPPENPDDCLFAKMSANYSADFETRVEPCVFGGTPDCSQCGCAASSGLHWVKGVTVAGPIKLNHFIGSSVKIGLMMNRFRSRAVRPDRWNGSSTSTQSKNDTLIQIKS
jgi:hypothetical protein